FSTLQRHFIQLRYPIRAGISEDEGYKQGTRRGIFEAADPYAREALTLERPDLLELSIHPTIAGHVPLLIVGHRGDFVKLVQAFSERNEPKVVLDSMGACIVKGLNNWSRIHVRRDAWKREMGESGTDDGWAAEFQKLIPQQDLDQDPVIMLSRGPYSAIPASDGGMEEREWLDRSLAIRREHE